MSKLALEPIQGITMVRTDKVIETKMAGEDFDLRGPASVGRAQARRAIVRPIVRPIVSSLDAGKWRTASGTCDDAQRLDFGWRDFPENPADLKMSAPLASEFKAVETL